MTQNPDETGTPDTDADVPTDGPELSPENDPDEPSTTDTHDLRTAPD